MITALWILTTGFTSFISIKFISASLMDVKSDSYLTPHTKIKSVIDQNVQDKTVFLEGLHNIGVGKGYLNKTAKAVSLKEDC